MRVCVQSTFANPKWYIGISQLFGLLEYQNLCLIIGGGGGARDMYMSQQHQQQHQQQQLPSAAATTCWMSICYFKAPLKYHVR